MATEQSPRTPQTFPGARLLAKDFDGTVAQTFDKSPGGVGVTEAYEYAIDSVFGPRAVDEYNAAGGLQNRAPLEVVQQFAPDLSGAELNDVVDRLVARKLDALLSEIGAVFPDGSVWPRPMPGYIDFLERLAEVRSDGLYIDDLILSSGHVAFIEKVYQTWSVEQPTHIVAMETMDDRGLGNYVKPSSILMSIAHQIWQEGYGVDQTTTTQDDLQRRTLYIGDDVSKDGGLAANSGVPFLHITTENSKKVWSEAAKRLEMKGSILQDAS